MGAITVAPMQWADLKDIDDVTPLNTNDVECLVELRTVLKKHNKLDRFGVALLHSHFHIASDEIMLESVDEESRTLVTKAVKQSDAGERNVGTVWMLREGDVTEMTWCRQYCREGSVWNKHRKAHHKEK